MVLLTSDSAKRLNKTGLNIPSAGCETQEKELERFFNKLNTMVMKSVNPGGRDWTAVASVKSEGSGRTGSHSTPRGKQLQRQTLA